MLRNQMARNYLFFILLLTLLQLTGCTPADSKSIPVIQSNNEALLANLLAQSRQVDELYYEEIPVTSYYAGGMKIINTTKVWYKSPILRTEQITDFYQDQTLLDREITGELYNYASMKTEYYYLGKHTKEAVATHQTQAGNLIVPREQTILWYLDKATVDNNAIEEIEYQNERCLIIEILKNKLGSTKIWVSTQSGLPLKVENQYNGKISERTYCNFRVGTGSISDQDLKIPPGATLRY